MTNPWKSAHLYVLMLTLLCLFYMNIVYSRLFFNLRWSLKIIVWHGFWRNLRKGNDATFWETPQVPLPLSSTKGKFMCTILICSTGIILMHCCFWKALFVVSASNTWTAWNHSVQDKLQLESNHSSFDFLLHNLLNFATSSDYMASNKLTFCTHK